MITSGALWGMCLLGIFYRVAVDTSGNVIRGIVQRKALRGTNITLQCPFPFDLNHSNVNVYWWREGNDTLLQKDSRKLFQVKIGGAYLHLLYVRILDAGTYQCITKYRDQTVGKGTHVKLVVYAAPAPLNIVSMPSELSSSASLRLQCRSAAFYPKEFNLTWHRNGTEILSGVITEQQPKIGGLYEVISSLEETKPIEPGTIFTCQVYHASNAIPANASFTVPIKDAVSTISVALSVGCAGASMVILLLIITIVKGIQLIRSKGAKRNSVKATQHEDQKECEAADNKLTYAALDLISSKKMTKPKQHIDSTIYAETKNGATDSELAYVVLNFTGSKKTSKPKNKESSLVYAAVKTRP